MVKQPFLFLLCICTVATIIIAWKSSRFSQTTINITNVDSILIEHWGDTLSTRKLSNEKADRYAIDWNRAESRGPCKYKPMYRLRVYQKDGMVRRFRANGKTIKEKDDYGFRMEEENYFEQLWESAQ